MKRTPLRRKTPLRAKKAFPKGKNAPRRGSLRKNGKSPVSKIKRQIQAKLRENAILRDGGCVLRHYPEAGNCGQQVLQAEHLNGRANSVSYAEMDNIVCLCQYHHIYFKKQRNALYWVLIRRHVGDERWKKVEGWILDKTPHRMTRSDWETALSKLST